MKRSDNTGIVRLLRTEKAVFLRSAGCVLARSRNLMPLHLHLKVFVRTEQR